MSVTYAEQLEIRRQVELQLRETAVNGYDDQYGVITNPVRFSLNNQRLEYFSDGQWIAVPTGVVPPVSVVVPGATANDRLTYTLPFRLA